MKKVISIFAIFLIVLCTACIYKKFEGKDKNVYYLALGDSLAAGLDSYGDYGHGYADYINEYLKEKDKLEFYTRKFAKSGYEVNDLIRDINNNREITIDDKKLTIQNALVKADFITLSIGSNDVINAFEDDIDIDTAISDTLVRIDELFQMLRYYSKEKIVVTSYYNPYQFNLNWNSKIKRGNIRLKKIAEKYNIIYVDIFDIFKDNTYLPNSMDPHPSSEGYKKISEKILEEVGDDLWN